MGLTICLVMVEWSHKSTYLTQSYVSKIDKLNLTTVNPPIEPALKYNPPSNTTLNKSLILLSKILPSKSSYENRTRGFIGGFTVRNKP